jgi:hypothetical protein
MLSLMEVYSMTDTTPLSPAAQAVRDAVLATYADNIPKDDNLWALDRASVVAALRAAADQVVPKFWHEDNDIYGETMQDVRQNLLAIAAELEAQ